MAEKEHFQHELTVRWSECGAGGRLKPAAWLDYCMEAADAHASATGFSMSEVAQAGHYWIMLRYRLRFEHEPRARERLRIETWTSRLDRLYAYREFIFRDSTGSVCARGTSCWLLVNKDSFRPVRPQGFLPAIKMDPTVALMDEVKPLPVVDFEDVEPSCRIVQRDEIDLLRHVSNPHYFRWAIETVPEEIWREARLRELEIDFLAMAFLGDRVEVWTVESGNGGEAREFRQAIRKAGEAKDLTRLVSRWSERARN